MMRKDLDFRSCLSWKDIENWYASGMCLPGVLVKATDDGIIVSEFELQSRFYVHVSDKYLRERNEPSYPPSYGLNSTTSIRVILTLNNLQRLICH